MTYIISNSITLGCQQPSNLSSNERRKIRRREHLNSIANDLIEETVNFYSSECLCSNNDNCCDIIEEWGTTPASNDVPNPDTKTLISGAVRKFLNSLPPRYAFGVDSPQEVLSHMRVLASTRKNTTKAFVDVTSFDAGKESSCEGNSKPLIQLALRPENYGMKNLNIVTIACTHTIGIMEFLTGLLVSGGSRILDTDYMLSSKKVMLIKFVVNKTGCIPLAKLDVTLKRSIEAYLCASYGVKFSCPISEVPLSDRIGAVDPLQIPPDFALNSEAIIEIPGHDDRKSATPYVSRNQAPISFMEFINPRLNTSITSISSELSVVNNSISEDFSLREKLEQRLFSKPRRKDSLRFDENSNSSESTSETSDFFSNIFVTGKLSGDRVGIHLGYLTKKTNPIVIKIATTEGMDLNEDDTLEELQREGNISKKLIHANVCKLLDVYQSPTCVCLAYEFCSKGSLYSVLGQAKYMYDYFRLATDIARGMAYLHSKSIIHRDLKPTNIFIDERNNAKIADFGMSIAHTGEEDLLGETGTYRWMAPEVIRHESYSINSDIYSFGIVFWQLVTRSLCPYSDLDPIEAALAVANKGARPHIPPSVPEYIRRTIKACWQEDQLRRPSFSYIILGLAEFAEWVS